VDLRARNGAECLCADVAKRAPMIKSFFDALMADELYNLPLLALVLLLYVLYRMLSGQRRMKPPAHSDASNDPAARRETTR